MGKIGAMIIYGLKQFFRDKADIFWVIFWPILWILMVAYVFVPPGLITPIILDIGVINNDHSNTPFNGTVFVEILGNITYNGTKIFHVKMYNSEEKLIDDLRKGRLDGGIIIPDGFGDNITYRQAWIKIYVGGRDIYSLSINNGVLKGFIGEFNTRIAYRKIDITLHYISLGNYSGMYTNVSLPGNKSFIEFLRDYFYGIAEPIHAEYEEVRPEVLINRANILGWYTLGAIGMMLLYSGMSWGAGFLASDRESGVLYRYLSTPMSERDYLVSQIFRAIVVLLIASLISLFTGIALGAHILWNPMNPIHWLVPLLYLVAILLSFGFGALIAPFAKTSSGASGLGVSIGLILAFTTGIWFPRSWLPGWLRIVADASPFTWCIDSIRDIMVYGRGWEDVWLHVIGSIIVSVAILIASWYILKHLLRKYIEG
jgi:ABC-2 type transport system permease protein